MGRAGGLEVDMVDQWRRIRRREGVRRERRER